MSAVRLDISEYLISEEDLPRPQWDLIATLVEAQVPAAEQPDAWSDLVRQWLRQLEDTLGSEYTIEESAGFLMLAPQMHPPATRLLSLAERCKHALLADLPGIAEFPQSEQLVVVILKDAETYYRYIAPFYPEGDYATSGGMQIRQGYAHIALYGNEWSHLEAPLAHELTHAALIDRSLPLWIEEGLAQVFEHDAVGRGFVLTREIARHSKRYWSRHGLSAFWSGEGYSQPGKVQEYSYQLSEVILRLLIEEHRPDWFGLGRKRQQRLLSFLRDAHIDDCGASAAQEHLGCELAGLAARFLGPGEWGPD